MLGLWLHTPLVRGQVNYFTPTSMYDNVIPPFNIAGNNTGNELVVHRDRPLLVQIYDDMVGAIYLNFDINYGSQLVLEELGRDYMAGSGAQIAAEMHNPDVSGIMITDGPFTGYSRFVAVYFGVDIITSLDAVFYEIWEIDPSFNVYQLQPPTAISNSVGSAMHFGSPNVDVNIDGGVVVGYLEDSQAFIKVADLKDSQAQIVADLAVLNGIELGVMCGMGDYVAIDVTTTFDNDPHTNGYIHSVVYVNGEVEVYSITFSHAYFRSSSATNVSSCGYGNSYELNKTPILTSSNVVGIPRISSHGHPGASIFDATNWAITFEEDDPFWIPYPYIHMYHGDIGSVSGFDIVNLNISTTMCQDQGKPAITYFNDSKSFVVSWEFYDCNDCIFYDIPDCGVGDPVNFPLNQTGKFILAKQYDYMGNRIYGAPLSVVNFNYHDAQNWSVAVSGKNYQPHSLYPDDYQIHFTFFENSFANEVFYKASDAPNPSLRPGRDDNALSVENKIKETDFKILQNPVSNVLSIDFEEDIAVLNPNITFMDISGKPVTYLNQQAQVVSFGTTQSFDVSQLSAGIYLVNINQKILKFIKI